MEAELKALEKALSAPERPVAALVGGAKVSTKLAVLGHLIDKVDRLIIGGGMANTFLHAKGIAVGASLCETEMADTARTIMADAEKAGCEIMLPVDVVVAGRLAEGVDTATIVVEKVPENMMILDVGPRTATLLAEALAGCRTLLWNGPLGAFEVAPFDAGTNEVARAAAALTQQGKLVSVAGGGDTVAALRHAGVSDDFSYISTAGGAFLEWLEGKELPGVKALAAA
jgi:phosphoglycerate kinase